MKKEEFPRMAYFVTSTDLPFITEEEFTAWLKDALIVTDEVTIEAGHITFHIDDAKKGAEALIRTVKRAALDHFQVESLKRQLADVHKRYREFSAMMLSGTIGDKRSTTTWGGTTYTWELTEVEQREEGCFCCSDEN